MKYDAIPLWEFEATEKQKVVSKQLLHATSMGISTGIFDGVLHHEFQETVCNNQEIIREDRMVLYKEHRDRLTELSTNLSTAQ